MHTDRLADLHMRLTGDWRSPFNPPRRRADSGDPPNGLERRAGGERRSMSWRRRQWKGVSPTGRERRSLVAGTPLFKDRRTNLAGQNWLRACWEYECTLGKTIGFGDRFAKVHPIVIQSGFKDADDIRQTMARVSARLVEKVG